VALQRRLVMDLLKELSAVAWQVGGTASDVFAWLRVRFQVENLKVLARGFANKMSLEELRPYLVPLPPDLELDEVALASAGSIEAFAEEIAIEPLREGVMMVARSYKRHPRPFFIEAGLDYGYFRGLLALTKSMRGREKNYMLMLVRQEVNLFHLALVTRGKFHYGLGRDDLLPLHLSGTGLERVRFATMLSAADLREVAARACPKVIDVLPEAMASDEAGGAVEPWALESLAWSRFHRMATAAFRRSHMGIGAVAAYVAIRRVELANLITLSEGIRAGLAPEAVRKRLVPLRELEAAHA